MQAHRRTRVEYNSLDGHSRVFPRQSLTKSRYYSYRGNVTEEVITPTLQDSCDSYLVSTMLWKMYSRMFLSGTGTFTYDSGG